MKSKSEIKLLLPARLAALILQACGAPVAPAAPTQSAEPTVAPAATASEPSAPAASTALTQADAGGVRKLIGTLRIAANGALPVPGAPETLMQKSWTAALAKYKELQPGVEVILEDLPPDTNGEQFCQANKAAKTMPDISWVEECNEFQPTAEQIKAGTSIATDFEPFKDEVNPYTGKPWQDDWPSEFWRTARCQELGAYGTWTCFTPFLDSGGLYTNLDILKEMGYDDVPTNYKDWYALIDKVNNSGKYIAFDQESGFINLIAAVYAMNVGMDQFQKAGGDLNDLKITGAATQSDPNNTINFCNGNFTVANNPSFQEALKLTRKWADNTMPGGAAAFFDPSRDQQGQQWLSGKALFRMRNTGFYRSIRQAELDGTLLVKNWVIKPYLPKLTKDDLTDPSFNIAFDGIPYVVATPQGDIFAPTSSVRMSGEDPNVDLMVRDFFQFMSSPAGQEAWVKPLGFLPSNPNVEPLEPRMKDFLKIKDPVFDGLGWFPLSNIFYYFGADPDRNVQAYLSGNAELADAAKKADEAVTRTLVKNLEDNLAKFNLKELPAECEPFATK